MEVNGGGTIVVELGNGVVVVDTTVDFETLEETTLDRETVLEAVVLALEEDEGSQTPLVQLPEAHWLEVSQGAPGFPQRKTTGDPDGKQIALFMQGSCLLGMHGPLRGTVPIKLVEAGGALVVESGKIANS